MRILNHISIEIKSAVALTIATFICKGINIISLPLFTRLLSTEEMGIVTTYTSWYSLLSVIANLALDSGSFNIAMMEYKDSRFRYMSFALVISTISSIIIAAVYFAFPIFFQSLTGLDNTLIMLMLVSFIFLPATTYWILHQRYGYRYKSISIVTLLSTGASTIAAAGFTYIAYRRSYENLAAVRLVSGNSVLILWGIFFYLYIVVKGKTFFRKDYFKFVVYVNCPMLIHAVAKHILDVSDRTMISYMCGKSAVGIYGVLYSVSSMALIVWSAVNASLVPYIFENMKEGKYEKISSFVEKMLLVYAMACLLLTLIAPEVLSFFATSEYYEGIYMMPAIAAGIFFTSLYNIYSNVLLYCKKTKSIMFSTMVAAMINIILNYICIKSFGYKAAAYTTLLSFVVLAFMQFIMLKRETMGRIIFNDKKIWGIALVTCIVCISINALYFSTAFRYAVIALIIAAAIRFRKQIFSIVYTLKRE